MPIFFDEHHLMNHVLPAQLGVHCHILMSTDLIIVVRSKNTLEVSKHYDKYLAVLCRQSTRNHSLEKKQNIFRLKGQSCLLYFG